MSSTSFDVLATRVRFKIKNIFESANVKKEYEDWYFKKYGKIYDWNLTKEAAICQSNL